MINVQCQTKDAVAFDNIDNTTFPKTLIYDGSKTKLNFSQLKKIGFDYVSVYSVLDQKDIPTEAKYILWTGIAYDNKESNWAKSLSPFSNDMKIYNSQWRERLKHYKSYQNKPLEKVGIIVLDIEAKKYSQDLISDLKKASAKKITNINSYRKSMADLYFKPLELAKREFNDYKLWSSYSDVPVETTWWGIGNKTWQEWVSNPSSLNYLNYEMINNRAVETKFNQNLNFYAVSAYYHYSPKFQSKDVSGQYLAYMLFQIEANKAWSKDKPIYLYQTFRYQGEKERNQYIDADMVKNSVIFSFMSGVDGLFLYDDFKEKITTDFEYLNLLKTYAETVSILNKYREYFTDESKIYFKPQNPRDLFVNKDIVVRGIEKNGKLLLAVANPFADAMKTTNYTVKYKTKVINISLKGNTPYLEEIKLN